MTIAELAHSGKAAAARVPSSWLLAGIVALSSSASFGLGILEGREIGDAGGLSITELGTTTPPKNIAPSVRPQPAAAAAAVTAAPPVSAPSSLPAGGEYVASKNGTKYYLPWCGTVKNIKEENKVWFATKADAEKAGYAPAANCKGI